MASETIGLAEVGKPLFLLKASRPDTLEEWVEALQQLFMNPSLGVPVDEARFFLTRLLCFLGAGKKRRLAVYEGLSWWDFTEAQTKSEAYKNIFARGLSRSLVAMKPDTASTLTVASMLVQILVNIVRPAEDGRAADRVLNAPTNDAWINPWVTQLKSNPNVQILNEHVAAQLTFNAATKKITSLTVNTPGGPITVGDHTDYYVAAVPVEVVQNNATLFSPALKAAAKLTWSGPSGAMGVDQLSVDWMTGVLFYLKKTVSAVKGHIIHCTSPWALTSILAGSVLGPVFVGDPRGRDCERNPVHHHLGLGPQGRSSRYDQDGQAVHEDRNTGRDLGADQGAHGADRDRRGQRCRRGRQVSRPGHRVRRGRRGEGQSRAAARQHHQLSSASSGGQD